MLSAKAKVVSYHGDELAVGGLTLDVTDSIAEEPLQNFNIASVPRHLDGVAD